VATAGGAVPLGGQRECREVGGAGYSQTFEAQAQLSFEAQAQLCAEIVPTADTPNFSTLPCMQGTIHA